jgi:hypothetical protein
MVEQSEATGVPGVSVLVNAGVTVTAMEALAPLALALTVVVPTATPATLPVDEIVAMAGLALVHVTGAETIWPDDERTVAYSCTVFFTRTENGLSEMRTVYAGASAVAGDGIVVDDSTGATARDAS